MQDQSFLRLTSMEVSTSMEVKEDEQYFDGSTSMEELTTGTLRMFLLKKEKACSAEAALQNISKQRVKCLQKFQLDRLGCITAIRGKGKSVDDLASLVHKKFTYIFESMVAEKATLPNGEQPSQKCMVITKVIPLLSKELMPRLFEVCVKLKKPQGSPAVVPYYDEASQMVIICNVCGEEHLSIGEMNESGKNLEHPLIHSHGDFNPHSGVVGIFTAGASDAQVMNECAMICRLNGVTVRTYPRWTVQRVTHDLEVPDIMEACDVVIAIAGGEGTFPNVVGGLTSRPVIGIPAGNHGTDNSEILHVMMNNCVPGIAVCNVDDGFNGAMQALSILRQKNRGLLPRGLTQGQQMMEPYRSNRWDPVFPRCVKLLEKARQDSNKDIDSIWMKILTMRREALELVGRWRTGVPNILGGQKPPEQVLQELIEVFNNNGMQSVVYATRVSQETYEKMEQLRGGRVQGGPQGEGSAFKMEYEAGSSICWLTPPGPEANKKVRGTVGVLSAGTADSPITKEAERILKLNGMAVRGIYDIGVNKIVRSMHYLDQLTSLDVLIVAAGMEGTLPGFISSFTDKPVIAIPTHIGYGTNKGGMTPMHAMLSSSSVGMVVVNVDNGFGAAMYALSVCRTITGT